MKTNLIRPCDKCPFRTDCLRGWLGRGRAAEIAHGIMSDLSFPCHETTSFDDEGDRIQHDGEQHCAGAMILLEKLERPNQWMRWMERLGVYDRLKMDMAAPVFDTAEDFIDHHAAKPRRSRRART